MKKWLAATCAAAALCACTQQTAAPAAMTQAQLVERGQYLVTSIGGCNDCHTQMTAQGPDMAHALQGGDLVFQLKPGINAPWAPHAPSIAGLPQGWSNEQFATFLQTGVRPNGSQPLPPMPAFRLNADDARAMTAYIRTVPRAPTAAPN